ncbi:MAG TPA: filamentous hemagglutinin N-terminal domain-containing protein, partial [Acetobacteraceae bacterium]|nr:filamentous hemagglutinin N-terminal domain-containing protein [Acetobacteraceae bacterium]
MENVTARSLLFGTALQTSLAVALALPAHAQPAPNARPTGGVVVGGSASISQTANNTAISQSSQRAAVNWQSFNVGSQQSVNFNQPSASAVTLNRVVGPDPSQIAGRINANGQVVLVNQSGVTFFKGAQVNTNGLMVSAIGMSNQAVQGFMASGKVVLDQPGNPNAAVINDGNITVRQAGLAALVAPQVANHGTITAELGHVVLAGAKTATLDLYGDGLLSLDVTNQVTQVPVGKDGKPVAALVTNTGVIIADGGTVQLTARAADGIVQNLVDAGGRIRAATVGEQTGTIALNGMGGSIIVEGQLSATGRQPGTTGGAIEVATDQNVVVASTARINASGKAGGGTVAIGTTLARAKGGPSVTPTLVAANTIIQPGAKISARASGNGNGGRVTILSTKDTSMAGTVNAQGGPSGGDGGFVEVSSDLGFSLTGAVDVSAPKGADGTILLDPLDLTIGTAGTDNVFLGTIAPQMPFNTIPTDAASGNAFISNTAVESLFGNIDLQASRDLFVNAPITLTAPPTGSGQSLTLEAGRNLVVNAAISTAGNITLTASAPPPTTPPPLTYPAGFSTAGALTLNAPVSTSNGGIQLKAGSGGINVNADVSANFVS